MLWHFFTWQSVPLPQRETKLRNRRIAVILLFCDVDVGWAFALLSFVGARIFFFCDMQSSEQVITSTIRVLKILRCIAGRLSDPHTLPWYIGSVR